MGLNLDLTSKNIWRGNKKKKTNKITQKKRRILRETATDMIDIDNPKQIGKFGLHLVKNRPICGV